MECAGYKVQLLTSKNGFLYTYIFLIKQLFVPDSVSKALCSIYKHNTVYLKFEMYDNAPLRIEKGLI